jgi:hypothetical protein
MDKNQRKRIKKLVRIFLRKMDLEEGKLVIIVISIAK